MEAIIFIGIQASGKSTFYHKQFMNTHMRIRLDLLNTRNNQRAEKVKIKEIGLRNCYSKLQTPSYNEGFDELFYVSFVKNGFQIKNWEK